MEDFFTTCGIKRTLNKAGISFETKVENGNAVAIIKNGGSKIIVSENVEKYIERRKVNKHACTFEFLQNNKENLAMSDVLKKAYLIFKRINNNNEN